MYKVIKFVIAWIKKIISRKQIAPGEKSMRLRIGFATTWIRRTPKTNSRRNNKCICGSNLKYKNCCLRKDEEKASREKQYVKLQRPDIPRKLRAMGYPSAQKAKRV